MGLTVTFSEQEQVYLQEIINHAQKAFGYKLNYPISCITNTLNKAIEDAENKKNEAPIDTKS